MKLARLLLSYVFLMRYRFRSLLVFFIQLQLVPLLLFGIHYSVDFDIEPTTIHALLQEELTRSSSMQQLMHKPPPTLNGIKRRIETDQQTFREILWAYGFFSAAIDYTLKETQKGVIVTFTISPGPRYTFGQMAVRYVESSEKMANGREIAPNTELTEHLRSPFLRGAVKAEMIEAGSFELLSSLRAKGYPLAKLVNQRLIAHPNTHLLDVIYTIDRGPLCLFGEISITGINHTLPSYVRFLSTCKEGATFSSKDLEETLNRLEQSGLFQSVNITESELNNGKVPITISVSESLRRTVGAGLRYTTTYGPGVSAQWAHRNFYGAGEELSFRADIWRKNQAATLRYFRPHVQEYRRNIAYVLEYDKNTTLSYVNHAIKASTFVEQDIKKDIEALRGLELAWLDVEGFNGHRRYSLLRVPLQLKVSTANNLLDPTRGCAFNCRVTPTLSFQNTLAPYLVHLSSFSLYKSIAKERCTLAGRILIGNIFAGSDDAIPLPDRFLGGSENVLRGYKSLTVSPLNHNGIPLGGRSMLAGTLEMRFRSVGNFGWTLFWDTGQVFLEDIPLLHTRYLHSTGIGFRYKTPLGPLRLDVAIPLNRRKGLDPPFQIYFSIGQAF